MNKETRLTLAELIRRKEQAAAAKNKRPCAELYIPSLDGTILIEAPSYDVVADAADMSARDGDKYLCYMCVKEPELKDASLAEAYGCAQPMDAAEAVFMPGEISQIARKCMELAGFNNGVKEIKNS